jgi:hypothetical protein
MLSPKTILSPGLIPFPTESFARDMTNPETCYVCCFNFPGS